jgi:hypothetical protein
MSTLLEGALALARRGLQVFPVMPRGKTPITSQGCLAGTRDIDRIKAWWARSPGANIGVRTGPQSDLMAIDVDSDAGETALRKLEEQNGPLPRTIEVITSRGRHIWYRWPRGGIANSAGKIEGVDVRGVNGFVVAPPSVHASGKAYIWSVDCGDKIAEPPSWLLDVFGAPKMQKVETPIAATSEVSPWAELLRNGLGEGARNDGIARLVGHYLPHHDPREVVQLALMFNECRCKPPLAEAEVIAIYRSIAAAELKKGIAL